MTTPNTATTSPDPAVDHLVSCNVVREKGAAFLRLDCSGLHKYLRSIGVSEDSYYKRFKNGPASGTSGEIDIRAHKVTTTLLLSWDPSNVVEGSADVANPSKREIDLGRYYSTPPTLSALESLAKSVQDLVPEILTHYQPVEISVTVVGKRKRTGE